MLKVLSLFSGIGAFEKALENLGIKYELVGFSEIDKYASASYCAIHGVDASKNLGDITKIDESKLPKDIDLITYGFPCQDISLAGRQKGLFNENGTQTRSGLFFEALRIIEATKPKFAIAENVKNLTGKKFKEQFNLVLQSLENAGYVNYWKVLNAKDFGVPQNRERVFIISIRSDINQGYEFSEKQEKKLCLKDMLEEKVDEKFYLSDVALNNLFQTNFKQASYENRVMREDGVCNTILARDYKDPRCVQVGQIYPNSGNPQAGRIYDADGISPTMDSCSGGNRMPKVLVHEATKRGYAEAFEGDSINLEQPNSKTRRGRVGKQVAQTLTTSPQQAVIESVAVWDGFNQRARADSTVVGTLTQNCGGDLKRNGQGIIESSLRIRKLTPKECWRLMGFTDADIEKAQAVGISNSQLYKQAGNSIVVPVLEEILRNLLCKR